MDGDPSKLIDFSSEKGSLSDVTNARHRQLKVLEGGSSEVETNNRIRENRSKAINCFLMECSFIREDDIDIENLEDEKKYLIFGTYLTKNSHEEVVVNLELRHVPEKISNLRERQFTPKLVLISGRESNFLELVEQFRGRNIKLQYGTHGSYQEI